jgi:hypothetical protein
MINPPSTCNHLCDGRSWVMGCEICLHLLLGLFWLTVSRVIAACWQATIPHQSRSRGWLRTQCVEGFRGLRIGIDASIWFYHATYGREGENPELRTLFFRCSRLLGIPLLPLFVFDGPKRPSMKRNKKISGKGALADGGYEEHHRSLWL